MTPFFTFLRLAGSLPLILRLSCLLGILSSALLGGTFYIGSDSFTVEIHKGYPVSTVTLETKIVDYSGSAEFAAYTLQTDVPWLKASIDSEKSLLRLVADPAPFLAKSGFKFQGTVTIKKGAETITATVRVLGATPTRFYVGKSLPDLIRPRLYFVSGNSILVRDTATNRPLAAFQPGVPIKDFSISPDGRYLYTLSSSARRIDCYDLDTLLPKPIHYLPAALLPANSLYDIWHISAGRGANVYVICDQSPAKIYCLDLGSDTLRQSFPSGLGSGTRLVDLALAPDESRLWLSTYDDSRNLGRLAEAPLDPDTALVASLDFSGSPLVYGLSVLNLSPSGKYACLGSARFELIAGGSSPLIGYLPAVPRILSPDDRYFAHAQGLGDLEGADDLVTLLSDSSPLGFAEAGRYFFSINADGVVTKKDLLPLLAPLALSAPIFPVSGAKVLPPEMLAWRPVPGALSYRVYLSSKAADLGQAKTLLGQFTEAELDTLPSLLVGVTYRWRVDVVHATGVYRGPVHAFTVTGVEHVPASLSHQTVQGVTHDEVPFALKTISPSTTWALSSDQPWLTLPSSSGQGPAQLLLRVNAANLPPGTHAARLSLTTSAGVESIPLTLRVDPLRVVQLINRPGTTECYALSSTGAYQAYNNFLLRIDAAEGVIVRAHHLESPHFIRFGRHPIDDLLYVQDTPAGTLHWYAPDSLQLAGRASIPPDFWYYNIPSVPIAGPAGTLIVQGRSLLNLATGELRLAENAIGAYAPAETSSVGFPFFVGLGDYSSLRRLTLSGDRFGLAATSHLPDSGASFVKAFNLTATWQLFSVSGDGSTLFENGIIYDADLNPIGATDDHIQSCSQDGRVAVGRRLVHLRPAVGAAQTKILPARIEASAYNDATGRIIGARPDGSLVFHDLAALPPLQAPLVAPAQNSDTAVGFSLNWSQTSGESLRFVYQLRPAGADKWTRTDVGWTGTTTPLAVGADYLTPETDYEVRFCLYGQNGRETDWTSVFPARTEIPRPQVLAPYSWQATNVSANMGEPLVFPISAAFNGNALSYTLEDAPDGLAFDAETLVLTGLISTPGRHTFRLVAHNAGGSATISITLLVRNTTPLAAFARYAGRQDSTLDPLDGWWTLTRSGNNFTGAIRTYAGTLSIKGSVAAGDADLVDYISERRLQGVPVTLQLQWDRALDRCNISLYNEEFGSSTSADSGFSTTWAAKTRPYPHAGRYTAVLLSDPAPDPADYPTPEGYGNLTVDLAADGTAKLTGETALGARITQNTFVSDRHTVPVFHLPDSANLSGSLSLETVPSELPGLFGELDWIKFTDPKAAAYRDGFEQQLVVVGAPLPPVAKNSPPLKPLSNEQNRADLLLSRGGLGRLSKPISQTLTPADSGFVVPKAGTPANPNRVAVKLDPKTGIVTGSAAVLNDTETKVVRTVSFRGMLLKDPLGDGEDVIGGYFLFPDAKGVLQSGRLEISEPSAKTEE